MMAYGIDGIDGILECKDIKGGKTALKKKIYGLMDTNGNVKLRDDFEFKETSKMVDLVHEWGLEVEYYGGDDEEEENISMKNHAIWSFFTGESIHKIQRFDPWYHTVHYNAYTVEPTYSRLKKCKEALFGLLVNAKSIAYNKFSFHTLCYPDGHLSERYEHQGDDLVSGQLCVQVALTILMADNETMFHVESLEISRMPYMSLWYQRGLIFDIVRSKVGTDTHII